MAGLADLDGTEWIGLLGMPASLGGFSVDTAAPWNTLQSVFEVTEFDRSAR